MLHAESWGQPGGHPLVLVHGFTQSGRSWGRLGEALGDRFHVTALDAPGHGRSATAEADLAEGAGLMAAAAPGPALWLGYSMGGRYALHVALRHPEQVRALVVVSATGGIDDAEERAERRRADEALAERAESGELEDFVRWWLQQPMFSSLPSGSAEIASRLEGSTAGLASSLRRAGTGSQEPLWDQLSALSMPVLVVAGERDQKYAALGRRLADTIGANALMRVVDGAGHACHLEYPDRFLAVVASFLESLL